MAANRFATMLHRNTHKMAVILIYTFLEWVLIALLLLNALFSFLIAKFAAFFGLEPPCILCSRLDHVFQPAAAQARGSSYRDLLCDAHAAEVSRLGYCSTHRTLAKDGDMCEDCSSSSRPSEAADRTLAFLSWMKRSEDGETDLRCSCCNVALESGFYSPYLLLKPSSWSVLEYTQKGKSAEEEVGSEGLNEFNRLEAEDRAASPDCAGNIEDHDDGEEEEGVEVEEETEEEEGDGEQGEQQAEATIVDRYSDRCVLVEEDASLEFLTLLCKENSMLAEEERLVPVELIDSTTLMKAHLNSCQPPQGAESPQGENDNGLTGKDLIEWDSVCLDFGTISEEKMPLILNGEIEDRGNSLALQIANIVEEYSSFVPPAQLSSGNCSPDNQCVVPQATVAIPQEGIDDQGEALADAQEFGEQQASEEEDSKVVDGEANCEISIGSEICDQEQINQSAGVVDQSSESYNEASSKDQVVESEPVEEANERGVNCLSIRPQLNEVEEERVLPETPTSIESIHALNRRFLLERRESGAESLDGSVASEMDGSEILTIDHLKTALRTERKALSALYAELEEERSASAIAANQTMAMITRLQEEKAAMQMEALQYQRMMEEQSEYDQEALQLLNELMMKREKEKQDLEKELELYQKKVLIYEAERRKMAAKCSKANSNGRSGTSSASSSADESDDLSFEFHEGQECNDYNHSESNQNNSTGAVLSSVADQEAAKHLITLDESLADFEEERLSILEQLKALEEKLFTMDGEDPSDNIKPMGHHFSDENGHGFNGDYESSCDDGNIDMVNGFTNGMDTNGKIHCGSRSAIGRGRRLLPLFDAVLGVENEDGGLIPKQEGSDCSPESVLKFTMDDHKRLAIAEEVDNVYERLQALEADREFLKHCIRSLRKGDKGMDLLQEILQHLRDLRSVELRVRNAGDALASPST